MPYEGNPFTIFENQSRYLPFEKIASHFIYSININMLHWESLYHSIYDDTYHAINYKEKRIEKKRLKKKKQTATSKSLYKRIWMSSEDWSWSVDAKKWI